MSRSIRPLLSLAILGIVVGQVTTARAGATLPLLCAIQKVQLLGPANNVDVDGDGVLDSLFAMTFGVDGFDLLLAMPDGTIRIKGKDISLSANTAIAVARGTFTSADRSVPIVTIEYLVLGVLAPDGRVHFLVDGPARDDAIEFEF